MKFHVKVTGMIILSALSIFLSKSSDYLMLTMASILLSILFFQSEFFIESWFFSDKIGFLLVGISVLITMFSIISSWGSNKTFVILVSLLVVEIFFFSSKILIMFIVFELSLIPMFALIIFWGKSPERIVASKFMLMYTFLASFPLLISLVWLNKNLLNSWAIFYFIPPLLSSGEFFASSSFFVLFLVLAFLVKVPLYVTHSWLPRAHVEAPLEGSMILAGVMLKLGLYGLIRIYFMLSPSFWSEMDLVIFCLSLTGSVYAMILALSVDDLKMCVAYSSISHMNICVASLVSGSIFSVFGCLISMISHALVSSLLFMNVTIAYEQSNSRSVLVNKGWFGKFPQVKLFSMLMWAANMSVPPFLSFIGEMKLLMGLCCGFSSLSIFAMISLFIISGSIFSMLMFGLINHSGSKLSVKGDVGMITKFICLSSLSGVFLVMMFFLL